MKTPLQSACARLWPVLPVPLILPEASEVETIMVGRHFVLWRVLNGFSRDIFFGPFATKMVTKQFNSPLIPAQMYIFWLAVKQRVSQQVDMHVVHKC